MDASSQTGYRATNTIAGTSLKSKEGDLGASIQIVTKELLDDISANDSNDLLLFTTNTETVGLGDLFQGVLQWSEN